ncbi:gasdermin-B isoform X2 [Alexandromys fortis]|uniref:gasdermin-B isoform X2 n=1 Tax=Alexandromys fortis TaxID=100897 RepID=UPI002153602F|nr:gasdermin-B isoform X2 [Microtus fortis]
MSLFESVTRSLVQELDSGGDMIPVKSMVDAGAFKCGYLVRGRKRVWGWAYYRKTDLTLEDILDEKDEGLFGRLPAGFRGEKAKFQVQDKTDSKLSVKLLSAILPAKLSAILPAKFPEEILAVERLRSCDWKTTIIHRKITQRYLDFLVNKKVKQKLPASFKTINMKENIYLVTETLETEDEETLQRKMGYKILCSLLKNYEKKSQRKITVPANTILAYRMKQLIFENGSISLDFWNEGRRRSFQGETPLGTQGTTETLKEHVENTGRSLQELDEKQKNVLCSATTCAIKEGGLEDLEQKVSAVLFSDASTQTEGPAGPLIRTLHDNAGCLVKARAEAILMLLDALIALSDNAEYVNEALENGKLHLLRDQVESVLQKNWGDQLNQNVHCDPEARSLCIMYIACSLLLALNRNKSTCVCL